MALSPAIPAAGIPETPTVPSIGFSPPTAQTLLQIFRVMYPHDSLDDSYYHQVVQKCAAKCSTDRSLADNIESGVRQLNGEHHWSELSGSERIKALQKIEKSPFFQAIRTEFIFGFYGDPLVWKFLGYEGPSNELGGYLNRGFDEIEWLNAG
jgi:hypothetical protein